MKFLCYIERINQMNRLLQSSNTGSPYEFANSLGVSRTRLYEMIDELRSYGAPITYNRGLRTFCYSEPFDIRVNMKVRSLDTEDQISIRGGSEILPPFFFPGRNPLNFTHSKMKYVEETLRNVCKSSKYVY